MAEAQSYKVGFDRRSASIRNVYEALRSITCEDCARDIAVGERFTRHKMPGGGPALYPVCVDCEPIVDFESLPGDKRVPRTRLRSQTGESSGYGSPLGSL